MDLIPLPRLLFVRDKKINQIIDAIKVPINHPLFFARTFALTVKANKGSAISASNDPIHAVLYDEYEDLSRYLDRAQIQESVSVRNVLKTRRLASLLITEKGELDTSLLLNAIKCLKEHTYSIGPSRQYDAPRQEHILNVLTILQTNKNILLLLKRISKPYSNKYAEDIIRETLALPGNTIITDAHAKMAILAAWLCYLRQNVGSCFATAPAEVVHDEQPELFFKDLNELLSTGRLKRVFAGNEYTVPLSMSWGKGDLKKPLVIQRSDHEFTPAIWYSQGLIDAFESVELLPREYSLKQKMQQLKEWIEPIFVRSSTYQSAFIVTAEEIIRIIMLAKSGLTEENIKDYANRPKSVFQGQLLIQSAGATKNLGGMGEKCAHFLFQFEVAKNSFKRLSDNALLKSWEFTLASFSETKLEFTGWNLYSSLGMRTNEPQGIGQCIYQIIQSKIEVVNQKVKDIQYEYEAAYSIIKTLEVRVRQARSEKELQWSKAEYQSHINEFYSLEELRDNTQYMAKSLVDLYDILYKEYLNLFKEYFQEVYDADMQEVQGSPFDDSPAGFRLLYKHGRSNTSQWTLIKNHNEYIEALVSFFSSTEPHIASILEERKLNQDLGDVVTAIINHVKTKEFLESAFYRMAVAHNVAPIKDPLDHLEHIEKKPWVYTSGGTMNTLVSCYYCIEDKPKEIEKWVESEMELLVFLADTVKHIPQPLMNPYLKGERSAMLMQSPTHAFLLKPMQQSFVDAWSSEQFTYTYVRDRIVKPAEYLVENISLDADQINFLLEQLIKKVSENYQPQFKRVFSSLSGPMNPIYFKEYLVDTMLNDRGLNYKGRPALAEDEIDSFLYSNLPLFSINELKDRIRQILILLPKLNHGREDDMLTLFDKFDLTHNFSVMGAHQLQDICKGLLCLSGLETSTPYNYHLLISLAAQNLGFAMPMPIIFADTNWVKDQFGFVVNPGNGKLELWRVDYTGSVGAPMTGWKQWLDGSNPNRKWGIYVKPVEYGQN